MRLKKTLDFLIIMILLFSAVTCEKKEQQTVTKEIPAIIGINEAPVYQEAGSTTVLMKLKDGVKVFCLNRKNPTVINTVSGTTAAVKYYQIKLPDSETTGWVEGGALAFKEDEEINAFVLETTFLYYQLDVGTEKLYRGDTVRYLGYKIKHDWEKYNWKDVEMWRVQVSDKECWIRERSLVPGAYTGIILEDVDLFKQKADRSENIVGKVNKMDIVPVLDKGNDGWITIIMDNKSKEYYITAIAGNPISYKEVDLTIISYIKQYYFDSKAIIDLVDKAFETSDSGAEIARITNKAEKIATLRAAETEIAGKVEKYTDTTFAIELNDLVKDIGEVINILEASLNQEQLKSGEVNAEVNDLPGPFDS